jgi:hypothetical protein
MLKHLVIAGALALAMGPAVAGPAGDTLRDALYAGRLAEGLATLEPLAAAGDSEAAFGVGALKLTRAFEGLSQALYRHGFSLPEGNALLGPGPQLAIPVNPDPEPLDYAGVRTILGDFLAGLDEARPSFVAAGESGDYVVALNPLHIRVDADGDGNVGETEHVASLFAMLSGASVEDLLAAPQPGEPPGFEHIGFDRADAFWLAGYTQIVGAQLDFVLAHDFSDFVNVLFHRIFPHAGFPMQDYAAGGSLMFDPRTDTDIADLIAAIHTLSWPVTEPARLAGVRDRLHAVLDLSRRNWQAILAETDNDHELLPAPTQTPMIPDTAIDAEKVAAWLVTLDRAAEVLDGELLIPHWRFRQGVDLRAYFETARRTDVMMLVTGPDIVPFLRDGRVASPADFRELQAAFGNDWLGYAFWFN